MCFFNLLGTILFIILLVWAVKYFVRGGRFGGWRGPGGSRNADTSRDEEGLPVERWFRGSDNALELARLRFARGEITADEFEAIKKGLQG